MAKAAMTINFKPTRRQYQALQLLQDEKTNEILYGGGARGGKSYFGCAWIILECLAKPNSAWIIGRNELKRLRQTTLITFFEVMRDLGVPSSMYKHNNVEGVITFTNGSIVFLIDLGWQPSDPNYDRIGSMGLTGAFLDEAQEINEKAISVLKGRFSKLKGEGWKTIPKTLYTCNPAKNWIYNDFYKPYRDGVISEDKAFIPALVTDNPHIEKEYIENLKKADNVTVQRLLYGNFDYDDAPGKLFKYDDLLALWTNDIEGGTKYIVADIARMGKDSTVIFVWQGMTIKDFHMIEKAPLTDVEDAIILFMSKYNISKDCVLVDEDGVGGGVVDHLKCRGFINNSKPISPFGAKQNTYLKRNFQNLKTQCYFELAKMIEDHRIRVLPGDMKMKENIIEELDAIVQINMDTDNKLQIIPKQQLKEKLGRSPDYADAIMMRMFFNLYERPETFGVYEHIDIDDDPYPQASTSIGLFDDGVNEGSLI